MGGRLGLLKLRLETKRIPQARLVVNQELVAVCYEHAWLSRIEGCFLTWLLSEMEGAETQTPLVCPGHTRGVVQVSFR